VRNSTATASGRIALVIAAFLRDWLGIVGLGTAMLAYAGARDPNVFPFYVDVHLVDVALLVSAGPALAISLLRVLLLVWSGRLAPPASQALAD
jgi:hypothetical protein